MHDYLLKNCRLFYLFILCLANYSYTQASALAEHPNYDAYMDKCKAFMKSNNMDSARHYAQLAIDYSTKREIPTEQCRAMLLLAQSSYMILPREGLDLYMATRKLAIAVNERNVNFRCALTIGGIYRRLAIYDSTKFYYNIAVKIANELLLEERNNDNLRKLGMVYNNYGAYYATINNLPKAAYYLVETEKIGRELKDTGMMMRAAINVGSIYGDLGNPENKLSSGYTRKLFLAKSMAYYQLAYRIIRKEDAKFLPTVLHNIGVAYQSMKMLDSANYFLSQSLELERKAGYKDRLCSCLYTIGSVHYQMKQFKLAEAEFDEAISLGEANNLIPCVISALSNKGQLLTHFNRLDESEQALKKALELKKQLKGTTENYLLYEQFYMLYEKKKDFKQALEYYKLFVYARDSISDETHLNILDELEIKYETEQKDEKISELSLEKQILVEKNRTREAELRLREFWLIGALVFLLMAGIIVWFWVQRNRLKLKQDAAELEHRLLRARMNPHFLFNGLNTIQQHYAGGDIQKANQFLADFSLFLRQILNKTGELKHSLEDELKFTQLYASLEQRKYPDLISYKSDVDPNVDIEYLEVPTLILQPLVENAIWHGVLPLNKPGVIEVKCFMENDKLVCQVKDNGAGYNTSKAKKGKDNKHISTGMELIKKRLGKGGEMLIEELNNSDGSIQGTCITLKFGQY